LDEGWDVLLWDLWGETGFGQAEPATPPSLEILVKRSDAVNDIRVAAAYYQLGLSVPVNSSLWHFCLWNSIRIFPSKANLDLYLQEIEKSGEFNEAPFYRAKLGTAPEVSMGFPAGVNSPSARDLNEEKFRLERALDELTRSQRDILEEKVRLKTALDAMVQSRSWRLTAPLRAISAALSAHR
jgi:hypothetical protein